MKAQTLLRSNNIFTAAKSEPFAGFVAVSGGKIAAVGAGDGNGYVGTDTKVYELGDRVVCPGFSDVHCFFTGYAVGFAGADLSSCKTLENIISVLKKSSETLPSGREILGHGWDGELLSPEGPDMLDDAFGKRPVVLFAKGGETCWMNTAAMDEYKFTPDACYPEAYWRLLGKVLGNRDFIVPRFKAYMNMLNSRGITSVKEMGFDDFYGFTDILAELENNNDLTLRVNFMSQPVGADADFTYGQKMRDRFKGEFLRFSGFNRMTDGSISQLCADLKEPYSCSPDVYCAQEIDYKKIENEVMEADAQGFRFSLHAQGDAAVCRVVDIYNKCRRDKNGRLVNRHSITDLEFSDPKDLERMGKLGVIAEIYPQIMSLYNRADKISMINEKIGTDRGRYYWNRRKMADSGVTISCATDLPLLIDDIPESIYHACGALFPDGGEPFNPENTLEVPELLAAWTKGGAYNLYSEDRLGTLEVGKLADIAVLNADVFNTPMQEIRNVKVCLTLVNGRTVYENI